MRAQEDSVAQAARDFGVGWHTAMAAVRDHGQPLVDDPARLDGVDAMGLDETVMLHAGPPRHTTYVTGFVDLHRGRLLDIALGRSGSVVEPWLARRGDDPALESTRCSTPYVSPVSPVKPQLAV